MPRAGRLGPEKLTPLALPPGFLVSRRGAETGAVFRVYRLHGGLVFSWRSLDLEITVATLQDVPKLCALLQELFAQETEFIPNPEAHSQGLVEIISKPEVGAILVARQEDEIAGMLNLLYTISTALGARVALLEDMVVSPESRGLSIGSELIDYAIEFAKERGCQRVTLLADAQNQRAHKFYERHGFFKSSMVPFRLHLEK